MRFGVYTPNFGEYADPRTLIGLARDVEDAGWDGFFVYDHIVSDAYGMQPQDPVVDPVVALSAIATVTDRIRLGPLVTALARRRPWKIAREITSLDHLSNGRVILGVGLGGPTAFASFAEEADARVRGARLDEALEVVVGLWSSRPFSFEGRYFALREVEFHPAPVQSPRVPIWVGGIWPNRRPFRRAAQWDGAFPLTRGTTLPTPDELREIRTYVLAHRREPRPIEIITAGSTATSAPEMCKHVQEAARAGATWWLEWLEPARGSLCELRTRVREGPPRIANPRSGGAA
jgi:probable F420-dependent oxidoreductase